MRKQIGKSVTAIAVAVMTVFTTVPVNSIAQDVQHNNIEINSGNILIDANLSDWSNITARASQTDSVKEWKAALSSDQTTLYFSYTGTASNEYDYNYMGNNKITISYADNSQGNNNMIQFAGWSGEISAKDGWYGDIAGASAATVNGAHQGTAGTYTVEAAIPVSYLTNTNCSFTFAGTTVAYTDIEKLGGASSEVPKDDTDTKPESKPDTDSDAGAVYSGIKIDGTFTDWAAVTKTPAGSENPNQPCLDSVAMVFDGDYAYIYVKEAPGGNAYMAGDATNGKFAITSDLGRTVLLQLNQNGTTSGIEGAESVHFGNQWEISVPKEQLPNYKKSINFGLYQKDPYIKGVMNLKDNGDNAESTTGIVIDGLYGDWSHYPHTAISYATPGTQENVVDAEGALYADGSNLYGHVVTKMQAHLNEAGGEFTQAVSIIFNNDWGQAFYPRFAVVDASGNINWNPQLNGLSEGDYEFYLFSQDAWHTSNNINSLNNADQWYGKIRISVGNTADECEFYLDLSKVATKLGCQPTDLKVMSAQFGRLGQQMITTAGASSGAWLGIILCCTVVGGVLIYRKRKRRSL